MNELENSTPTLPEKPKEVLTARDSRFMIAFLALSVLFANLTFYGDFQIGFTFSGLALLLCAGIYLRARIRYTPMAIVTLLATVAVLCSFGIWENRADFSLVKLAFLFYAVPLFFAYSGALPEKNIEDARILKLPFAAIGISIFGVSPFLRALSATGKEKRGGRKVGSIFIGLAIVFPVVLILFSLLQAGDAAFSRVVSLISLDVDETLASAVLGILLFAFAFSYVLALRRERARVSGETSRSYFGLLDSTVIGTVLLAVSALYIVFLLSQFSYFFYAFAGIRPEEYTYSEYARRGFGELCVVCVINLALILFAEWFVFRDSEGRLPKKICGLSGFIALFSLLLLAISAAKMTMYVDAYAMTWMRLLPFIFMCFLFCVFVAVLLHILRPKFRYIRMIVISACVIMTVTSLYDPAAMIVDYNTMTYDAGWYKELDYAALANLGDVAVPMLCRHAEAGEEDAAQALRRSATAHANHPRDFRNYSLAYLRAEAALAGDLKNCK